MTEYGCTERKCPCRLWVNCHNYTDRRKQAWRIRKKEYDFHVWYKDHFRGEIKMADILANG